jgi:cytoskeletal protein CcmA (bactofilin family)
MARKTHDDALGVAGAETVIGTGVEVQGNLTSESDIIVDGNLDGSLKAGGNVAIGVNATVKGDIQAVNVTVAGTLVGDITASGEADIRETGHVKGNIHATGLAITSGGVFIGRSYMDAPPRLAHDSIDESDHELPTPDNEA